MSRSAVIKYATLALLCLVLQLGGLAYFYDVSIPDAVSEKFGAFSPHPSPAQPPQPTTKGPDFPAEEPTGSKRTLSSASQPPQPTKASEKVPSAEEKLRADMAVVDLTKDEYWRYNNDLSHTKVEVSRNEMEDEKRLFYDPRITLAVYFNHIRKEGGKQTSVPFSWSDWVDLSILREQEDSCQILVAHAQDQKKVDLSFCVSREDVTEEMMQTFALDQNELPGLAARKPTGQAPVRAKIIEGKSHLYTFAPIPDSIIFMTGDGTYEVETSHRQKMVKSEMFKEYVGDGETLSFDSLHEFSQLKETTPTNKQDGISHEFQKDLDPTWFRLSPNDVRKEIEDYESRENLSLKEKRHMETLKYSSTFSPATVLKYFYEARLEMKDGNTEDGSHYDWRFYSGSTSSHIDGYTKDEVSERRRIILHRLIRNWIKFTNEKGIVTWIAHGSLLSWYWNGISFPWDNDIDVQMPIAELNRFSRLYNQSLVVEDASEGYGRYFIDSGSFITHRVKGNGRNNIDARFIDVDSGMYIDITGLALTDSKPPGRYDERVKEVEKWNKENEEKRVVETYQCRNNHFYALDELSPMKYTLVEGVPTYIPNKFEDILKLEYRRGLEKKGFKNHFFIPFLRLWVPTPMIKKVIPEEAFTIGGKADLMKLATLVESLTVERALAVVEENPEMLREYFLTRELTKLHQEEMEHLTKDTTNAEAMKEMKMFGPLRKSLFQFDKIDKVIHDEGRKNTENA